MRFRVCWAGSSGGARAELPSHRMKGWSIPAAWAGLAALEESEHPSGCRAGTSLHPEPGWWLLISAQVTVMPGQTPLEPQSGERIRGSSQGLPLAEVAATLEVLYDRI